MEQTTFQPPMAPPQPHVMYAGFWKRFAAYLIDKIILSFGACIIIVPFAIIFGVGMFYNADQGDVDPGLIIAFIGAYFMLILGVVTLEWLYFAMMESRKGATLGKMVLNIHVT